MGDTVGHSGEAKGEGKREGGIIVCAPLPGGNPVVQSSQSFAFSRSGVYCSVT